MRTIGTRQQRALASLTLFFVTLWALGTLGWRMAAAELGWMEAVYRGLQMFSLNFDPPPRGVPRLLQFARFAQPAFTVLAFAATVSAELRLVLRSLVSRRSQQVTIIGYGVSGKAAAGRFAASMPDARLVALDHSLGTADHRAARRHGVELIDCDALDAEARGSFAVGLKRSENLVIACGTDQTNLSLLNEVSHEMDGLDHPVRVWLHLSSHALAERLRESYHCPRADAPIVEFVEAADHAAQSVVLAHPLVLEARAAGLKRVHAVIHGFDDFGWLMAEQVLLNGIFPGSGFAAPRVSVIADDAAAAAARWHARHPGLDGVLDVRFHEPKDGALCWSEPDDPVMAQVEALTPSIHIFAGPDSEPALASALALRDAMRRGVRPVAPIVVRSDYRRLSSRDLAEPSGVMQLRFTIVDGYDAEASVFGVAGRVLEDRARAIHASYAGTTDPLAFDRLPHSQRLSNRRAAYHMLEKLRLLGFEDAAPVNPGYGLSARGLTFLRQLGEDRQIDFDLLEHLRWRTDRLIEGWRAGPRNSEQRLRDRLGDDWSHYEELPAGERRKDRSQFETLVADAADTAGTNGAERIVDLHWEKAAPSWSMGECPALAMDEDAAAHLMASVADGVPRLCVLVPQLPASRDGADRDADILRGALTAMGDRLLVRAPRGARVRFMRPAGHPWNWLAPHPTGQVDGVTLPAFSVSFVGHRDPERLGDRDRLVGELRAMLVSTVPPGTRLFVGLADGADRLMASLWSEMAIGPITGLVPYWQNGPALGPGADDVVPSDIVALCERVEHPLASAGDARATADDPHAAVADALLSRGTLLVAVSDGINGGSGGVEDSVRKARIRQMPLRYIEV